jgi:ankyrin repeat protein
MKTILSCIQNRDLKGLKSCLEKNPLLAEAENEQGLSPIMIAAYHRFTDGVSVIASFRKELTLPEAVVAGKKHIVKQMIEENPSLINQYMADGFTALGLAGFFGHTEIVRLLLSNNADPNQASQNDFRVAPLHSAVAANYDTIAEMLLENGADPDKPQQQGIRPVHSAAHNGNLDMVRLLLKHGADPSISDENGKTAISYAIEVNANDIIKLLTEYSE